MTAASSKMPAYPPLGLRVVGILSMVTLQLAGAAIPVVRAPQMPEDSFAVSRWIVGLATWIIDGLGGLIALDAPDAAPSVNLFLLAVVTLVVERVWSWRARRAAGGAHRAIEHVNRVIGWAGTVQAFLQGLAAGTFVYFLAQSAVQGSISWGYLGISIAAAVLATVIAIGSVAYFTSEMPVEH